MNIIHSAALLLTIGALASGCSSADAIALSPSPVGSRLTLTTTPAVVLRSGSTATVHIHVTDDAGTNVAGAVVEVSTDAGALETTRLTTDANGLAATTLTAAAPATVRASGAGQSASVDLSAMAPFRVSVLAPSSVTIGSHDVTVTTTTTAGATYVAPSALTVACGGATVAVVGGVARCAFAATGAATVTATAASANGWTTSQTATVTVLAAPLPPAAPTAPRPAPTPTLTATVSCVTAAGSLSASCNVQSVQYGATRVEAGAITGAQFDWGDGRVDHVDRPYQTHVYAQPGTYTLYTRVAATTKDGVQSVTTLTTVSVPKTAAVPAPTPVPAAS